MKRYAWPISIGLSAAVGLVAWVAAGAHMTPADAIVAGAIAAGVGLGVWAGLRRPAYDWSSPSLPTSYKGATRAGLRAVGGLQLPSLLAGLAFAVLVCGAAAYPPWTWWPPSCPALSLPGLSLIHRSGGRDCGSVSPSFTSLACCPL